MKWRASSTRNLRSAFLLGPSSYSNLFSRMSNFHSAHCSKLSRVSSNLLNRGKFRFSGGSWHGLCTLHAGDKVTQGGTMKKKQVHLKSGLALLGLATFFC